MICKLYAPIFNVCFFSPDQKKRRRIGAMKHGRVKQVNDLSNVAGVQTLERV